MTPVIGTRWLEHSPFVKFDGAHGPGSPPLTVQIGANAVIRGLDEGQTTLSLKLRYLR